MRVVAVLETMWDWRQRTSSAGYSEAPRFFRISPDNYSGKRLYKLVGPDAQLLVTNACRELVSGPGKHGKPDPAWLAENLTEIELKRQDSVAMDVLLVCGNVAQETYRLCGYRPIRARVLEIPHPAARGFWTGAKIQQVAYDIQNGGNGMPGEEVEYIGRDGAIATGRNQLTKSYEATLREHLLTCDKPLYKCKDCWMPYSNIGQDAYNEEITRAMVATGHIDPEEAYD